ncbi:MAG: DUF167 domain-containing protein [Dehalococcoidia bacterium]
MPASVTVAVRVTPGARKDEIAGWRGDVLLARVQARPMEGKANKAVVSLLAETLGVRQSAVRIVRGEASRDKLVEIDGLSSSELEARLPAKS